MPAGAIRRATRAAAAVRWRGRRLRRSLSYGFWEHRDGTGIERINQLLLRTTVGVADLLRDFGATVEGGAIVHGPLVVHNASAGYANLAIGRHAHVGRLVVLDLTAPLSIEPEAVVSMGTTILTHADVGERPLAERYPRRVEPTRIGAGSYVGANATILCGCHVGAGAVVGAGSVVTKPVAPGAVVAGVPARSLQGDARVDPPIG